MVFRKQPTNIKKTSFIISQSSHEALALPTYTSGLDDTQLSPTNILDYLLTVFEAEKYNDGRPLFGAVRIRFTDPIGSLDLYFRVVEMHLVFQDVSYFCLCCFPVLVREFLDAVNSNAISARVVV